MFYVHYKFHYYEQDLSIKISIIKTLTGKKGDGQMLWGFFIDQNTKTMSVLYDANIDSI